MGRPGRLLAERISDLPAAAAAAIVAETLRVLAHPDFAAIFGPGSRAEQPLCGEVDGIAYTGQVDRLLVTADEVLVVDYKSGREPPPL